MATSKDVADILIIGSGASGGVFAWVLSKVSGLKIVCLEQGTWSAPVQDVPASQHPEAAPQRQRLVQPPAGQDKVKSFKDGYPYDYKDSYWTPILANDVGGASVHYGAVWARLHPSDFVTRSLEGVGTDWPIRYWDLEPFYDQIDNIVGVTGQLGNPAYPPIKSKRQPNFPMGPGAEIMARGFKKLGWHFWPGTHAIISEPTGNRRPCPNNCVACDEGCPREAKNSSDVVFWPEAIRNGVVLKTRSRVREITVNSKGLADGALYYDAEGKLQEQKARLVVVAANGIGTPRLLLNSKSNRFPHGLANSSGLVGRNLMAHPMYNVSAVFEDDNTAPRLARSSGLVSDQFYEGDPGDRGFARGFWYLSGGYTGPVRAAIGEPPSPKATLVPAVYRLDSHTPLEWGRLHHAAFQQKYQHTVSMQFLCEELANDHNRLELDPTLTDDLGIPAPKLFFERTENLTKMAAWGIERTKEMLMASGASKITAAAPLREGGAYHLMGTARMGDDPGKSVVDKYGRAHDVKNLWIIDGSIFPTAGAVVVTNTIQALALRTADYVKNNIRNLITT